jgi:hypothetical protein
MTTAYSNKYIAMFVKAISDASSCIRKYAIYSKHTHQCTGSIIINLYHIPKIALDHKMILFHLPTHTQTIEYENQDDAEKEFENIYSSLKK